MTFYKKIVKFYKYCVLGCLAVSNGFTVHLKNKVPEYPNQLAEIVCKRAQASASLGSGIPAVDIVLALIKCP